MSGTVIGLSRKRPARRSPWTAVVATIATSGLLYSAMTGAASAATGGPDTGGYTFTDSTESGGPAGGPFTSIASTGTDIGNHGDEAMTTVGLPFPVTFYDDAAVSKINVNSNGNIQFNTDNSQYGVTDLPTSTFFTAMLPFWADLVTDVGTDGIFTQTLGSVPNRQFVIEWDAHTYNNDPTAGAPEQFQVVLTENSPTIEYRYLDVALNDGTSDIPHLVGIQGADGSSGEYLQYTTGSTDVVNDLAVDFTRVAPNSATTVRVKPNRGATYGQSEVLTARVTRTDGSASTPTGAVTFSDNGTVLGTASVGPAGQASLTTRRISGGVNTIRASYSGDGSADASTGWIADYLVDQAPTTTTVSPGDGSTTVYGQPFTATVAVVAPGGLTPSGIVSWYDNSTGHFLGQSPVQGGRVTLPKQSMSPGPHQVDADFSGSANYAFSRDTINITVIRAPVTIRLTSSANPAPAGTTVKFSAVVRPEYPGTMPTGSVTFYQDGNLVRTVTLNAKGIAATTFPAGNYSLVAFYESDTNFLPAQSNTVSQTDH